MRLLSLDYDPVYADATRGVFDDDVSVYDYDVVIWDPEHTFSRYTTYSGTYQNLPSLSEDRSVGIIADVKRRRAEFLEFLRAGRTVVVLVRPAQECFVDTGQRTYSGTGRNRVTTRQVETFDLWSALPVSKLTLERASGTRIEILGDGPLPTLLRKYKQHLHYDAVVLDTSGTAIAKIQGTERILGSVLRTKEGGHIVLLPAVSFLADDDEDRDEDDDKDNDEDGVVWLPQAAEFQVDLLEALEQLSNTTEVARPAWAQNYATEDQQKLRAAVVAQQTKIENARAKLAGLQQEKVAAEASDQLFLGSGRVLENQVREVLELLGGEVTEPQPGRDDWRVTFSEGNAVVEVKGVSKSAAEKHAAQLEKWVAGAYEESGKMPKGILVVNTWRETPLTERTKEDFPAQMLPYSEGRGHCLVTGLQLFVIQAQVKRTRHEQSIGVRLS
jgi:hypothetical protein